MRWAPDIPDKWALDLSASDAWALDSSSCGLSLGTAVEHFLTAKAAEGASPKTLEWYRMVLRRAGRDLGVDRALDSLTSNELRAWLLPLRGTLSPISVAGYVRGLKAFGNWCATEDVATAATLRALRRPRVPNKLVEPLDEAALRRLLGSASVRDRDIVLLMLDTGMRLSELAGLRAGDLRLDGSAKVMGKGARERIVPVAASPGRRWFATFGRRTSLIPRPQSSALAAGWARGVQQVFKRSRLGPGFPGAAVRTPCVTRSPVPTC